MLSHSMAMRALILLQSFAAVRGVLLRHNDNVATNVSAAPPSILVVDHVPKCAGTFVNFMARGAVDPSALELVTEADKLTKDNLGNGRFILGMVRNPIDYYISIWAYKGYFDYFTAEEFQQIKPLGDPAGADPEDAARFKRFVMLFSDRDLGLLSFLVYYSYLDLNGIIPETWDYHGRVGDAFQGSDGQQNKAAVIADLQRFSEENSTVDCWVRTESATEDTTQCFQRFAALGGPVNFTAFTESLEVEFTNTGSHLGCGALYDAELLDYVRAGDAEVFRAFHYPTTCSS
mmetsp:Transcript_43240/g.99674  ORF Transcript_43240/g.99674 Transcript_43240/m.99674 type:complete len:289 (-) Transcript_43240:94-960(-)